MAKIKICDEVREIMIDSLGKDLSKKIIDSHLGTCADCFGTYEILTKIQQENMAMKLRTERAMGTIDWQRNAEDLTRLAYSRDKSRIRNVPLIFTKWQVATPVMTGILLLGIWLGYIFFHATTQKNDLPQIAPKSQTTFINQMETVLTKKEMAMYFKDTQIFLTHFLRECDTDSTTRSLDTIDRQRIKILLNKNRYFDQNISNPELLSTRLLLEKIEFILYEILAMEGDNWCSQIQQIQKFIKKENLMLKLHLVSKDVSFQEV